MKTLDGKFMENNLKYGRTISYFSKYFNLSEEEFLEKMKKTFSTKAYKCYLARLRKNEKQNSKKSNCKKNNVVETITVKDEVNPISKNNHSQIVELQLEKEKLKDALNSLELQHKELCSERTTIRNSVLKYKEKLKNLKEEILQCKSKLSNLLIELDNKLDIMHNLNSSISETREKLSEIDSKIEDLKKISIFFYNTGELELETENDLEIPEYNEELFKSILFDEQSENYTVKQLKTLSKLLSLVQKLGTENLKYEVIFEDSSLEDFFSKKLNEVITQ